MAQVETQKRTALSEDEGAPVRTLRLATLLVRFLDSTTEPFTPEDIRKVVHQGQVGAFLEEASFGRLSLAPPIDLQHRDVFGWYTLNTPCTPAPETTAAIAAADADVDFTRYDGILILPDSSCSPVPTGSGTLGRISLHSSDGDFTASVATVANAVFFFEKAPLPSGGERPYDWTSGAGLILHELGHNLGLDHANAWECGPAVDYGDCRQLTYGNLFDVMGRGWNFGAAPYPAETNAAFHFNAYFKHQLGWLSPRQVLPIVRSGKYRLSAVETAGASIAVIRQPSDPEVSPFFIEARRPIGYDASLRDPLSAPNRGGLFIYRFHKDSPGDAEWSRASRLLDMSPTDHSSRDWYDVALGPQESYFDPAAGIRIVNLGRSNGKTAFRVDIGRPECLRIPPVIIAPDRLGDEDPIPGDEELIYPGETVSVSLGITNGDTRECSSSRFETALTTPAAWHVTPVPDVTLAPSETTFSLGAQFTVSLSAMPGEYAVEVTSRNAESGLTRSRTVTVRVSAPPVGRSQ